MSGDTWPSPFAAVAVREEVTVSADAAMTAFHHGSQAGPSGPLPLVYLDLVSPEGERVAVWATSARARELALGLLREADAAESCPGLH